MERIKYIDYSKGLGILLIIFAHCIQYFESMWRINSYVCSFHVPIFFIAAGLLAYHKREEKLKLSEVARKRAKMLLIPYAIFSVINSGLKLSVLFVKHSLDADVLLMEMKELLITGNGTVWFLFTLFGIEMLFLIFNCVGGINRNTIMGVAILFLCAPYLLFGLQCNSFGIVVLRIIGGMGYYLIGYLISPYIYKVSKGILLLISLVGVSVGGIAFVLVGSNYSFFNGIFANIFGSLVCSLFSGIGFISFMRWIEVYNIKWISNILSYYGRNSLIVMLIHPILLLCFTYPFGTFISKCSGSKGVVVAILLWGVIVLLEMPFIWLINHKLSWMIGHIGKNEVS